MSTAFFGASPFVSPALLVDAKVDDTADGPRFEVHRGHGGEQRGNMGAPLYAYCCACKF